MVNLKIKNHIGKDISLSNVVVFYSVSIFLFAVTMSWKKHSTWEPQNTCSSAGTGTHEL